MKIKYDFHIHSALSPCADDDMTPANIVGVAKLNGLDMIAIADHNAIKNVQVAMEIGKYYEVEVVPAFELQTSEDLHLLCLFSCFEDLQAFHKQIEFFQIKNKPEIYGNQFVIDEDDNVIEVEENLLLTSAKISSSEVPALIEKHNGIAIPAHVDREANGMVAILGSVTDEYFAIELSNRATANEIECYSKKYRLIVDSDAHTLDQIGSESELELEECSAKALISYLKKKIAK